jgi:hypothetical protein
MSKPRSVASPKKPKSPMAAPEVPGFWRSLFSYFLPAKVQVGEVISDEPVVAERASPVLLTLDNEETDVLNDLKSALITMVKDCRQPRWFFEEDNEKGVGNLILKVRKNQGVSAVRSAELIVDILRAYNIPVTRDKTVLAVSSSVKIDGMDIADKINEMICEQFAQLQRDKLQIISATGKKLRVTEEFDSRESKEASPSISPFSADFPTLSLSSPESKNTTPLSRRKKLAQADSKADILTSPRSQNRQRPSGVTLFSPPTTPQSEHGSSSLHSKNRSSPTASPREPEPFPGPIVWNVKGQTIVYDPAHPERSDVHPIMSTGGRQFLLFTLGQDDFTTKDAYKKMKAIGDVPTVARQHGNQGVVFLTKDEGAPSIEGMTKKQRDAYGVIRAVDGTRYIPSVKLKILGETLGDIRAYGFDVKSPTNEVLNVVDAVDENSHKRDERRKKK